MKRVSRDLAIDCFFDWKTPPVLHVEPDESFVLETHDCFRGALASEDQLPIESHIPGMFKSPPDANFLTGPVFVDGAEAGDVLAVTIERLTPVGQGVSILSPTGGGILADTAEWADAVAPFTKIVKLIPGTSGTAADGFGDLGSGRVIPLAPMIGTIGVAPARERVSSASRQGPWGGNLDCRDVRAGATIFFNCYNDGGLLSIGDVHCMQGAGELTGCACDVPAEVQLSCRVFKRKSIRDIRIETESSIIAIGIDRPLERSVAKATSNLLHWLTTEYGLSAQTAYMLLSINPQFNLDIYQLIPAVADLRFPVGAEIAKSALL
ncbi:MAG: acetamidase/formamidase family protein [Thermomicrobiales bacterium]